MFLLDTNVISELRRPDKADRNVVTWANAHSAASFFISAISILEIEVGALLITRKDQAQGHALRMWIDHQVLPRFEGRVLAATRMSRNVARVFISRTHEPIATP
jgi:hypothetical protein